NPPETKKAAGRGTCGLFRKLFGCFAYIHPLPGAQAGVSRSTHRIAFAMGALAAMAAGLSAWSVIMGAECEAIAIRVKQFFS
ncbi:MAG: hypothetical protein ACPG4N_13935, partial [Gammaproteobacteria bacterium]